MKICPPHLPAARKPRFNSPPGERGSAVIVVLILAAIVLIYAGFNLRTLRCLSRELRLIEEKQTRRWVALAQTNSVSTNALGRAIQPASAAPRP